MGPETCSYSFSLPSFLLSGLYLQTWLSVTQIPVWMFLLPPWEVSDFRKMVVEQTGMISRQVGSEVVEGPGEKIWVVGNRQV